LFGLFRERVTSREQALEVNSPDITNVVFHDEQVALVIHRDGA
jgi:hypothetical protein